MSVLMTPEALTVLAGLLAFGVIVFIYRHLHPPGAHRASRYDYDEPDPYPGDAAGNTIPGAFLGAPVTEVIPRVEVSGTPPWPPLAPPEQLVPLPEPRAPWPPGTETRALVVDGWDEPGLDEDDWAETSVVGLYEVTGGYAYPDGFPPCHHDQHETPAAIQPWPAGAPPLSPVEVELFRLRLETAARDGTVYELMGGDR